MNANRLCPRCGNPLPPDAPQGLCPRCLGALNLGTQTAASGETPAAAQPPLSPAELAPHFPQLEILECLGRGGMGVVYKARQKSLNRLVALKLVAPERANQPGFAERFAREAHALALLNHPNIVTVHDFGQAGGFYFLLMEFVDGVNLGRLLAASRLSAREALAIVPQICDALQYAHDQGIVHRDIKPENLLLDRLGRVKVADFGLAKLVGTDTNGSVLTPPLAPRDDAAAGTPGAEQAPALTQDHVMGTPHYMSPEQIRAPGEVDHRTDIYALGVVFYQMLTGELPGQTLEPPSRKVRIDVRLDEVVLRTLETQPERRYQTAAELRTQIETVLGTPPSPPPGPSAATQVIPPRRPLAPALVWTARGLGLLGFLFVLMFVLADGFPPFWKQPAPVRVELAAMVLMLAGLLAGWRREGLGAALIGAGWATFAVAERGWPPWPFTAFLAVAALYALGWWREADAHPRRSWKRELIVASGVVVLAVAAGALLSLPTYPPSTGSAGYERAVASDATLSVTAGPNRFAARSVVRNDQGGTLRFEDGRGRTLNHIDFKTNPQLVRQAEWLDLVNVAFGVDSSAPDAEERYDVIEARVFDHRTRQLLGVGQDRWGVGWDMMDRGLIQIRAAGRPLPDKVDVWFRMASYAGTQGVIRLRPVNGASTNLAGGQLTVREVRDGQWGYQQRGDQISWFEKPMSPTGCTVVLDWRGQWSAGRQQIQLADTAARARRVFPPSAPHFVDFRQVRTQIVHFDVPLSRVGDILLRPFGGRHTFYFKGVQLPSVRRRTLSLPPAVTLRFEGAPGQAQSRDLDPVIVRMTALRGRTERVSSRLVEDSGLDPARYVALAGPVVDSNSQSTVLFRVEGLGHVPVQLTLLDRQGRSLPPPDPNHRNRHLSLAHPGLATIGLDSFALPWDRVGAVRVQLGATQSADTPPPARRVASSRPFEMRVAVPAKTTDSEAIEWEPAPGRLETLHLEPAAALDETAIASAVVRTNAQGGFEILIGLTASGAARFEEVTAAHVGSRLAILVEGRVQSAPRIMQAIPGGKAILAGNFSETEARRLAAIIARRLKNSP